MKESTFDKYKLVIDEWFVNSWNGVKAYQEYFPKSSYKSASVSFAKILEIPRIQEYIQSKKQKAQKTVEVTHQDLLQRLKTWFESDITETMLLSPEEVKALPKEVRQLITEYTLKELIDANGDKYGQEVKLKFVSKEKAADMIAKHIGFYGEHNKQKSPALKATIKFADGSKSLNDFN